MPNIYCGTIAGSVVLPLDYRTSGSNAMLTTDLVPIALYASFAVKGAHTIL